MNAVEGFAVPPTFRLKCISIAEIGFGILAIVGSAYNVMGTDKRDRSAWGNFSVACSVLLLGTGLHAFYAIRRLQASILDSRSFRIVGACNVVLCILCSIATVILLFVVIFLATLPNIAHSLMGFFAFAAMNNTRSTYNDDDDGDDEEKEELRRKLAEMTAELSWANNMLILQFIGAMVVAGILVGLTATAATISFRMSTTILAVSQQPLMVPPAGVPLMTGPGYGTYPTGTTEPPPTYSPYPPIKKDLI